MLLGLSRVTRGQGVHGYELSATETAAGLEVDVRGADEVVSGPVGIRAWRKKCGQGSCLVLDSGDRLSREYLGHCFEIPGGDQKLVMNFLGGLIAQTNCIDSNGASQGSARVFVR